MSVGVLDVGSNTIRLLVARVERGDVVPVDKEKVRLPLGEEIERYGFVSDVHVAQAAKAVRRLTGIARDHGVDTLDVFLTAPGRQSRNADELLAALTRAARYPVRVLTTEEEGRFAYAGAVATSPVALPGRIAVCDVGGASTEVAVGAPHEEPRLGPVGRARLRPADRARRRRRARHARRARRGARRGDGPRSPRWSRRRCRRRSPSAAAPGPPAASSARRSARRSSRRRCGSSESKSPRAIARRFGVDRARAHILPGGLVLLAEVQRRLGVPLQVCDGGIREGAVLASAAALAA